MLLELNQKQKGLTLFCTAACAAFVSYALGRKLIPQTILSAFAVYLLTGDRPSIVYATIVSLPRDIRWVNISMDIWRNFLSFLKVSN